VTKPRNAVGISPRAVLFDLDDTLFDHEYCARTALMTVHAAHSCFGRMPFEQMEIAHARHLEDLHAEVLGGRVGLDDARVERFRRLFGAVGERDEEAARRAAAAYRDRYVAERRAVSGAAGLLRAVRTRARIGIVSNNLFEEQQQKLRTCGLEPLVDALIVSEEVGVSKPDPAIFREALQRLDCGPAEAVMIGDSWAADVIGARAAGIRAIWFNRHGAARPEPLADEAEITGLEPPDLVLEIVFREPRT
jgi:HAD superfamily hydrolase (TIGR01549 family)